MIVFHSDLDNTMIFSYKHDIGPDKRNVEWYQGREISFVTEKTYEMLRRLTGRLLFVPTTTRTSEQYRRIDLGIGTPGYALTCNGGVLLVDGKEDAGWYEASRKLTVTAGDDLKAAMEFLESDPRRSFEVRNIRDLFVFTKCEQPEAVVCDLKGRLDGTLVNVFSNGTKVYIVPKNLSKGTALRRFRKYAGADLVIAAGDSEFDISMLREADVGLAPKGLSDKYALGDSVIAFDGQRVFSEHVLEYILHLISRIT